MHRRGFTLIELLVVASIFALTVLLATTVFAGIQSRQRAVHSQERVTSDGRYILETIARSIRTSSINYSIYAQGAAGAYENQISLVDSNGSITCYHVNVADSTLLLTTAANADCSGGTTNNMTPNDMQVVNLQFAITPKSDPFRPFPRSSLDCSDADTFNSTRGVCGCTQTVSGVSPDCFSGQECSSTANIGQRCAFASGTSELDCTCKNPNIQPQVTIELHTRSLTSRALEQGDQTLQTTVVSRVYQR